MPARENFNVSKDPEMRTGSAVRVRRGDPVHGRVGAAGEFGRGAGQRQQLREPAGWPSAEKVLASEKKPLRVFLCDGRNDNRGLRRNGEYDETRDWFQQNVRLMKALRTRRYTT